jgi:Tfp pilus assembly protein PilF
MKHLCIVVAILTFCFVSSNTLSAQGDVSDETGLPIPIGASVIYGQVSIEGLPKDERRPNIFVSLLISGTQIERRQTDGRGYFFFLERPRHGHSLVFEVDGREVGRVYLTIGISGRLRQDVTLDWKALNGATETKPGVAPANIYVRSADAEKSFDKAMAAIRENKNEVATTIFTEIVAKDPKDYLAWTMLGTIYYTEKKFGDAAIAFEKALELKPDFSLARINLGKVELSQKNYDKAIQVLTRAVELEPNSADANHFLGEAYLQVKKGTLAVGFLNKAIKLAPIEKAEIHLRLAALYNGAMLKDRAALEYKAFLEKVPNYADKKKLEEYIKDNTPK